MDRSDWVRVINHTNYLCRSKQNLFFEERVVKYIRSHLFAGINSSKTMDNSRIVGTHSSVNNTFQLGNFEALFTLDNFEIDVESTLQS
jgi:BTB/POZ domain-containing protein 9